MSKLYVLSGPSGAGLGEIVTALFARRKDLCAVTPVTDLLEATEFAGNDYGTSRKLVNAALAQGRDVLLNLPVERAKQLKANMPEAVCLYVEPSEAMLKARYEAIARSRFELSVRLEQAEKERALSTFCDKRICSDEKDRAVEQILAEMQD